MESRVDKERRVLPGQSESSLALCHEGSTRVGVGAHRQHGLGIGNLDGWHTRLVCVTFICERLGTRLDEGLLRGTTYCT